MKLMRKIIEIDEELCDGCGQCVPSCAEGAIEVIDGKARIVAEKYCDGLGACMGECPRGALRIVEREAEDFDEEAVEVYLKQKETAPDKTDRSVPQGCPSTQVQTFIPPASDRGKVGADSQLSHWPIQINLIQPSAPFLKGADLLVAADCTPAAFGGFQNMLKGKVLMIGCPKFDEVQAYLDKLTRIFRTAQIKSITSLIMEVPCCSGLPGILKKAMEASGNKIPMEQIVISTRGVLLDRKKVV